MLWETPLRQALAAQQLHLTGHPKPSSHKVGKPLQDLGRRLAGIFCDRHRDTQLYGHRPDLTAKGCSARSIPQGLQVAQGEGLLPLMAPRQSLKNSAKCRLWAS